MFSAAAARAVGPPHGRMFIVPLARPATTVSTTGGDAGDHCEAENYQHDSLDSIVSCCGTRLCSGGL